MNEDMQNTINPPPPLNWKPVIFLQGRWSVLCNPYLFRALWHLETISCETEIPTGLKLNRAHSDTKRSHWQGNTKCSFFLTLLHWIKKKKVITAFSLVKPRKWIDFNDLRIHHKYPTERLCTAPLWSIRHFFLMLVLNCPAYNKLQRHKDNYPTSPCWTFTFIIISLLSIPFCIHTEMCK